MWYSWFIMIQPISVLPHLLNWIIFWIEFFWNFLNWIIFWIEFLWKILNWIIFWIEFSWNTIELNIELNHFLAKFKYWIESIWVSLTPMVNASDDIYMMKYWCILYIDAHLEEGGDTTIWNPVPDLYMTIIWTAENNWNTMNINISTFSRRPSVLFLLTPQMSTRHAWLWISQSQPSRIG